MVEVIVGIVATGVVADPAIIFSVDVWSLWMAGLVVIPGARLLILTPLLRRLL
jgi:hypothetical protein